LPIDRFGRWESLVSASFLHGGVFHILFNMIALYQLGPFVILEYGVYRFLSVYILSGVGGFYLSYLVGIPFTLGASAAICGLIGAILYFGKSRGGLYGESIYRQALGWVVGLIFCGLLLPGINNWAHGGGLITGIVVSFFWVTKNARRKHRPPPARVAMYSCNPHYLRVEYESRPLLPFMGIFMRPMGR